MGYCLISLINVCIIGTVSWIEGGCIGLGFTAGYILLIFCLPLCPLSDKVISFFFYLESETTDMKYLEKSVYLSFAIYKVIINIVITVVLIVFLMMVLFWKLILLIGSNNSHSVIDSICGIRRVYSAILKKVNKLINTIIGTLVDICNYARRKRMGTNLMGLKKGTLWVGKKK